MATGDAAAELWSSLEEDLLGVVYARLTFPADRIRFAAVCTSWRVFASTCPPRPVLPWLVLDPRSGDETKSVYCSGDGTVLPRVPIPSEAAAGYFIGGYDGGWLVSSEAPLGIVNLFSYNEVVFSPAQKRTIRAQQSTGERLVMRKVVFSEAPTSSGCILAAITDKLGIAICRVGYPEAGWATREFHGDQRIMDIAFYNGELYGLVRYSCNLVKFDIGVNKDGGPVITAIHKLNMQYRDSWWCPDDNPRYIVELHGKLLLVVRNHYWAWQPPNFPRPVFTVHELVESNTYAAMPYRWMEMTSLGDYALFLGPTYSKAVPVPTGRLGGVQRNHIYHSYHRCFGKNGQIPDGAIPFLSSSYGDGERAYYRKEEDTSNNVEAITSVEYYVRSGLHSPMWLLPPDM